MTEITWGPEIAVNGKRPDWLKDKDWVTFRNTASYSEKWSEKHHAEDIRFGGGIRSDPYVTLIRLPADHPHYATQQPRTAPSGGEVGPEVLERMIACLRAAAAVAKDSVFGQSGYASEARAIVALLEPVDPAKAYVDQVFRGISDGGPMSDEGVKWMMEEAFKAGSLAAGDGR